MPGKDFRDTVDLPNDKAVRVGPKWKYSCGLEMVEKSIKNTPTDHAVTKNPSIMIRAHMRHHSGLATDYVTAGNHDPTATLYFKSRNGVLIDAWCSCGFGL